MMGFLVDTLIRRKSRVRRLQNRWLGTLSGVFSGECKVLDLGGVKGAEYHALLGIEPESAVIWNMSPETKPDRLVDLDVPSGFPAFPADCRGVLALNLLEHLYRPLELLTWACAGLPSGGKLVVVTPFCYPVHPSPNDYWRLTPQAYERFFAELAKSRGITGELKLVPLGEDVRDGISSLTTPLIHGENKLSRLAGAVIEGSVWAGSLLAAPLIGRARLARWARDNALAIGLVWTKN
jgi:hypothetical protein